MGNANRLAGQTSPYLLQHADNPVDWWPWSPEAFAEARRRDVPVLISVGYSACHWCHVMAHESFEDDEVAGVINAGFVAVKVDREERPDVDAVYMEAVQLVTGNGGWPMTVVATPDGSPFWAGTYLPKGNFLRLLGQVSELWSSRRAEVQQDAARLAQAVQEGSALPQPARPEEVNLAAAGGPPAPTPRHRGPGPLARAAIALLGRTDPEWGGNGGAPKFPQPATLEALTTYWWRSGDGEAGDALRLWLDAMSSGGIYDHLGGGFARYSTDRKWLVPHFEKMLYDNALLTRAYTQAWQLTALPRYRQVVRETVEYLLSPPMRLAEGVWASAEDADSEGEEGRFYVWEWEELVQVAGPEAATWYGASPEGNWEGRNILWRPERGPIDRPASIEAARSALRGRRARRRRPGLDAKVLTEWNAMAVAVLATAGRAMAEPTWVDEAARTAEVLVEVLRRADGRWLRSWRPGTPALHLACAGDYAWLTEAFTALGEATGQRRWTEDAARCADALIELFWDDKEGAFFTYGNDAEALVARLKDIYDGAVPSANAVAARALARLGELTGQGRYLTAAADAVEALSPAMARAPGAFPAMALAADVLENPRRQVVVTSSATGLVAPVWARFLPDTVLAWGEPFASPLWEGRLSPAAAEQAFVCQGYQCRLPVRTAVDLAALLDVPAGLSA